MGTNYYLTKTTPTHELPLHIGKSSSGWLFLFKKQWCWNDYTELVRVLYEETEKNKIRVIIDEYDEIIPFKTFVELINKKQNDKVCLNNPDNFLYNENINGYRFTDDNFC